MGVWGESGAEALVTACGEWGRGTCHPLELKTEPKGAGNQGAETQGAEMAGLRWMLARNVRPDVT